MGFSLVRDSVDAVHVLDVSQTDARRDELDDTNVVVSACGRDVLASPDDVEELEVESNLPDVAGCCESCLRWALRTGRIESA